MIKLNCVWFKIGTSLVVFFLVRFTAFTQEIDSTHIADAILRFTSVFRPTMDEPFGPAPLSHHGEVWIIVNSEQILIDVTSRARSVQLQGDKPYILRLNDQIYTHEGIHSYHPPPENGSWGALTFFDKYDHVIFRTNFSYHDSIRKLLSFDLFIPGTYRWYFENVTGRNSAHGVLFIMNENE